MSRVTRFTFMVRTETTGWGRFFCERKSVDWQKWENIWSDSTCFITLLCKPQISPRLTHYFTFTFLYLLATIHSRRYKGWFRVANNQPQFESHHWIRLRTPETELGVFYGDLGTFPAVFLETKSFFFFLEVGPSPSVFVATVTGF